MLTALEEKQILKLNDQLSRDITVSLIDSDHPQRRPAIPAGRFL